MTGSGWFPDSSKPSSVLVAASTVFTQLRAKYDKPPFRVHSRTVASYLLLRLQDTSSNTCSTGNLNFLAMLDTSGRDGALSRRQSSVGTFPFERPRADTKQDDQDSRRR